MAVGTIIVGVYLNTQLTYMLQSESMFNIDESKIGQITSDLTVYSLPFSMITTFLISYVFEILGRKLTLFISFFLTSILYYLIPYTAPNYNYLIIVRCLIGVTMAAPISHPLVADYVKIDSRGKATALIGCGMVLGEVTTMGVIFNYTKNMTFFKAFKTVSLIILGFSFYYLIFIKDPNMKNLRKGIKSKMKGEEQKNINNNK